MLGLLIMMGHQVRSEALFYYFRLEDQIPENHLLRLIDKHVSFEFVGQQLKGSYSDPGRPSIDPELLVRILLIGPAAHSADRLSLWHRERAQTGGRTAHASGVALVYGPWLRSGDFARLDVRSHRCRSFLKNTDKTRTK